MFEILTFSSDQVTPEREPVFASQGIPAGESGTETLNALYAEAMNVYLATAQPLAVMEEISKSDFEAVYHGEGRNEPDTPVADVFPRADALALFVVTLGERISNAVDDHFSARDFALACMLDAVASAAADATAEAVETRFQEALAARGRLAPTYGVLRYSPGYCGWHVSGQKRLFEFLKPERIGVSLRESFLMEPLKSVSGVLIAGPREIHQFSPTYFVCEQCTTRDCQERMRKLSEESCCDRR